VQEFAIRYIGARPEQVVTIPNAVPIERFRNIQESGVRLRQEFDIAPQAPVVGIVARLMPQKDHATFLAAAARVHQQIPDVRFLIVGEGPLLPRLIDQTQELGLQGAVIFAGLRRDVPAVMAAIDVLAFSSKWEGLPVAMLEGMAAGKPVVATAVNGIPGVLADGKMGILAPPNNPEALAEGMMALLQNPVLAQSMGATGYEHVAAHYSISAAIQRTAALYQRLIGQHRDKGAFSGAMS
jgi:glycosyltransferase involved in cell wall biosynthesis